MLTEALDRIDSLKSELDALRPLAPEDEQRLWQKLRLEWNYNSNHIEGNTLTYGETFLPADPWSDQRRALHARV
ncbi:MAG: hypothetical protein IPO60_00820 [Flavobacteriales bacterium]|nr:hypothetical protein [Flavobacteriales bacterium]